VEEPQEVQDEEYERVWERVAAIDVATASGVVCTRVPGEARPGRRRTKGMDGDRDAERGDRTG
jgi:transposase